ncbi:MAG: M4 family metallopeptidase, partial [Nocardioides sp.]
MRTTLGLAAAAALAAGTLGLQTPSATSATGPADRRPALAASAVTALQHHPAAALPAAEQEFRVVDTIVDRDGSTHVRMDRTIAGLPVLGGDLVVHRGPSAGWRGVSQTLRVPLTLSTKPEVAKAAAQRRALRPAAATDDIRNLRSAGAPRLVVDALAGTPRLAWEITTLGRHPDGTPSRLATYVDARSGSVLRREEQIQTADGSGQSLYSGTVAIQVTQSGSTYTLTDATRGSSKTTDMQNKTDSIFCQIFGAGCSNGVAYSSPDTAFGSGSNANRESAAVDAHYGGAVTFDYFKLVHGRNGIFGNGTGAPSRVHYGSNYVNAFWDGAKMTYGDGDGTEFGPLVSLDVAGHEMSHGVTATSAKLAYRGESGGLNEANSDIMGTMVEFYAHGGGTTAVPNYTAITGTISTIGGTVPAANYLIGEQLETSAFAHPLRWMYKPSLDGASKDAWSTSLKRLDVHYSSGP